MRNVRSVLAFVTLAFAGGSVVSAAPAVTSDVQVSADASALAALLVPETAVDAQAAGAAGVLVEQLVADDAALADLVRKSPGLDRAVAAALVPVLRPVISSGVAATRTAYGQHFAERFSAREIQQMLDFYRSPTGTLVRNAMTATGSAAATLAQLAPDQLAQIQRFADSPTGQHFTATMAERRAIEARIADAPYTPATEKALADAASSAVAAFLDARDTRARALAHGAHAVVAPGKGQ